MAFRASHAPCRNPRDLRPPSLPAHPRYGHRQRPRGSAVSSRRSGSAMGHRHHRAPNQGGQGLLCRRPRCLFAEGGRLVDRRNTKHSARDQRFGDGHRAAPAPRGDHHPQRPWHPIHLVGLHPPSCRFGPLAVHGLGGRLLRQRGHPIILEQDAGRVAGSKAVGNPDRVGQRDLRVPRDLSQSAAPTLVSGYAHPGRVRGSTPTNDGSMSPRIGLHRTQDTPEPL